MESAVQPEENRTISSGSKDPRSITIPSRFNGKRLPRVADKLCRFPALARTCERQGRGSATGAPTEDCVSLRETFQRCYKRGATARAKNESFVDYACGFGTKKRERGERQSSTHLNLSISPLPRSDPRFLLDASCRDHCVYVQANTRDANDDSHQNSLGWKL